VADNDVGGIDEQVWQPGVVESAGKEFGNAIVDFRTDA